MQTLETCINPQPPTQGYGGVRRGAGATMKNISPLVASGVEGVKSIVSGYKTLSNDNVTYTLGGQSASVDYLAASGAFGNGFDFRTHESCVAMWGGGSTGQRLCRERLANMDQVVCGIAYDNTRSKRGRWSGARDPNGDDVVPWRRDHSNGDYGSDQHCWRIVMQAPPSFVTDPEGESSPFAKASVPVFGDHLEDELREKTIQVAVNQSRSATFIAQDPQAKDRTTIFVTEEPGIPRGMNIGKTVCLPRNRSYPMCSATNLPGPLYPNVNMQSSLDQGRVSECSRASLTVEWTPSVEDAGRRYRVCAVARDDSPMCASTAPTASSLGWYGDQHCTHFYVVAPRLSWRQPYDEPFGELEAVIGCEIEFTARAADVSCRADETNCTEGLAEGSGNYAVEISHHGELPKNPCPKGVSCSPNAAMAMSASGNYAQSTLKWRPDRGTEGRKFVVCFTARDTMGIRAIGRECQGGNAWGAQFGDFGCRVDEDCIGMARCVQKLESCITITVARCKYCVKRGNSLTSIMKEFAVDVNWLRLWSLNANAMLAGVGGVMGGGAGGDVGGGARSIVSRLAVADPSQLADAQMIYIGTLYTFPNSTSSSSPQLQLQQLTDLSARFRTTVKSILSLNFDIGSDGSGHMSEVCIIPCNSGGPKR